MQSRGLLAAAALLALTTLGAPAFGQGGGGGGGGGPPRLAPLLMQSTAFEANRIAAGLPANFFRANTYLGSGSTAQLRAIAGSRP